MSGPVTFWSGCPDRRAWHRLARCQARPTGRKELWGLNSPTRYRQLDASALKKSYEAVPREAPKEIPSIRVGDRARLEGRPRTRRVWNHAGPGHSNLPWVDTGYPSCRHAGFPQRPLRTVTRMTTCPAHERTNPPPEATTWLPLIPRPRADDGRRRPRQAPP